MDKDQITTPGTTCPTLCDECVGSLTSPAIDITVKIQETVINTITFDTRLKTAVTEVKSKINMQSKCPITFHTNLKSSPFK